MTTKETEAQVEFGDNDAVWELTEHLSEATNDKERGERADKIQAYLYLSLSKIA